MLKKILTIICLVFTLEGCVLIAGAAIGAGVTGAVIYDKRTAKETEQDKQIIERIEYKLNSSAAISNNTHIVVTSFYNIVLLAGTTPDQALKDEVYSITKTVPGIRKIYNELEISGSAPPFSSVSDSVIATKIKTQLIADEALNSSQIQVVTVNGNVYLMGKVTQRQADIATNIVQHVSGVQKVVKAFEYPSTAQEWA